MPGKRKDKHKFKKPGKVLPKNKPKSVVPEDLSFAGKFLMFFEEIKEKQE